jgi:hypothetical protein
MSQLLNVISEHWMEQFKSCILASMTEAQFRTFTLFVAGISEFDAVRENKGFQQDLPLYISLLRKNGTIGILLKKFLLDNDVVDPKHPHFLQFKTDIEKVFDFSTDLISGNASITLNKTNFEAHLLRNDIFPFLNRHVFRKELATRLDSKLAKVIFVKGNPRSGMSYLGKFLNDLCDKTALFELYDIEVPYYLDSEEKLNGVTLAKAIAAKFDFDDELEDNRGDKFKFVRFANRLADIIAERTSIPILFLHDFHRIPILDEINSLFYELLSLITKKLPNLVVVIAGFESEDIRNWHSELKYLVKSYTLEDIVEQDVDVFLALLYDKYEVKINALGVPLSKTEYIENMKAALLPENKIDIAFVGELLTDHLYKLNE